MPRNPPQLVIRADASRLIGGGHVQRCLSLAETLRARGWSCALAASRETPDIVALPDWLERLDLEDGEPVAPARRCDLLIVDHYDLSADWESSVRPWCRRLMVIDDLADRPHDGDLLLDQAAGRTEAAYRPLVPATCRLLLGPAFAILRPAFAAARSAALARRAAPGRRILINFGAADPENRAGRVLQALAAADQPFDADVVCGASSDHIPALAALAATMPGRITVHGQVAAMAALMTTADLAIGAAGSASWERCALGLPAVVLTLADNQAQNARMLDESGAAWSVAPDAAAEAALALLRDPAALTAMSSRAASLCDGLGAQRVAQAIDEMFATAE